MPVVGVGGWEAAVEILSSEEINLLAISVNHRTGLSGMAPWGWSPEST